MNLNQITVPSKDVAAAIRFYEKLGLHLIVESLPHYARFECPSGDATFSIHEVTEKPEGPGVVVYFEIEKLDEVVKDLMNDGVQFDEMPENKRWLWREARLKDPDGNQIILYYAGTNRKNPPWRIN